MSKMHYFSNKFSKIARRWGLFAPSTSEIIGNLRFCDLAKLWFFKLIMTKLNFEE